MIKISLDFILRGEGIGKLGKRFQIFALCRCHRLLWYECIKGHQV